MKLTLTAGHAWAYTGVTLGAVASVAANVAHAYVRPAGKPKPEIGAVLTSGLWPVALLIAVEVLVRVNWRPGVLARVVRYVGVGLVASVAAVVSYQHLSSLLRHYHETTTAATIGPLAIDGLMLVCTAALLTAHPASTEATPDQPARATETPASAPDPDPAEPTPDPPSGESSVGSGAKPDQVAGEATGSTPPRLNRPANGADSGGAGGTKPVALPAPTARPAVAPLPARSTGAAMSEGDLREGVEKALKVGTLARPLSATAIRTMFGVGAARAGAIRDEFNAHDQTATDDETSGVPQ